MSAFGHVLSLVFVCKRVVVGGGFNIDKQMQKTTGYSRLKSCIYKDTIALCLHVLYC